VNFPKADVELLPDKYRLQLLAAITTTLSDDELRALARLIFHNVDLVLAKASSHPPIKGTVRFILGPKSNVHDTQPFPPICRFSDKMK
jgi:hypothetical protein